MICWCVSGPVCSRDKVLSEDYPVGKRFIGKDEPTRVGSHPGLFAVVWKPEEECREEGGYGLGSAPFKKKNTKF